MGDYMAIWRKLLNFIQKSIIVNLSVYVLCLSSKFVRFSQILFLGKSYAD